MMNGKVRQSPIIFVGLALMLVFTMALLTVTGVSSAQVAQVETMDGTSPGPQLWRVQESNAYVYTPSMSTNYWASLRMPSANVVIDWLKESGAVSLNATEAEQKAAAVNWYKSFLKKNYVGPDPLEFRRLMQREKALISGDPAAQTATEDFFPPSPRDPLYVVVEFAGTDTITRPYPTNPGDPVDPGPCVDTEFTWGPMMLGEMTPPGPRDNFTFFKPDIGIPDYESVIYGEGPDAPGYGVIDHPSGQVDLTGLTMQNYFNEMSRGTYHAGGGVFPEPIQVNHSHQYYGYADYAENADGTCVVQGIPVGHNARQLPRDVVAALVEQYGDTYDWSQHDADGDHIIDLFGIIHAGGDPAAGDSEDFIWSHSSAYIPGFEELPQIGGLSTPDDPSDDYFISGYNQDPEQLDLGVIQEEFEHQFGLPDLYSTDGSNSNAWWGAHSAGVWGGPLGATRPVGHNLWQDYMLGWRDPVVVNYDDAALTLTIGRARYTPEDTADGLIVKLPPQETNVPNNAGDGIGWWSNSGDLMNNVVYRDFDLSAATGQVVFSFDAAWDIEQDWDYGYVEVSTDGGAAWVSLPDMDGVLTDTDPNGNNQGWGLTGTDSGHLSFDLSAYAGSTVGVRLRYLTDPAVSQPGWWVDNLSLDDDSGNLYTNDLETDFSDWTNEGWVVVPFVQNIEQYYTVEWRDNNGFDKSLNDPYYFYYNDENESVVSRLPYSTPGMLVMYRNTGQDFDYEISSDLSDSPSYGPKFALLAVDSHFEAMRFDTTFNSFQDGLVGLTMNGRVKSGNAAFSQHPTNEKTAILGFDLDQPGSPYVDPPLEEKTWSAMPGEAVFHDAWGYYPGFYYPGGGSSVYLHDWDASLAMPATADYTTRVTWPDSAPFPQLYGVPIGPAGLGTGNPGDDGAQYGVHVAVVDEAEDRATVHFWNAMFDMDLLAQASAAEAAPGDTVDFHFFFRNTGTAANFFGYFPLPAGVTYVEGSAFGGLVPVNAPMAQALAAKRAGQDLMAMATTQAADVQGFIFAYNTPTKGGGPMGYQIVLNDSSAGTRIAGTGTFFDMGYGGDYLSAWKIASTGDVAVAKTIELPLLADTWINGGDVATNNNGFAALIARTTGLDNVLLAFDRSMLPVGTQIVEATLTANIAGQSGQFGKSLNVLNAEDFDPAAVTYTTAPNTYNPSTAVAVPDAPGSVSLDVSFNVTAWDAVGAQAMNNTGYLAISASGPAGRVIFDSMETWNATPVSLQVTYLP